MDLDFAMDPEPVLHRDLRSPSIPKQRRRKTFTKYYSYRAVHPSWIGQSYYTLQLVSSTVHTARVVPHRLRHKIPDPYITHVTEKEEPALYQTLRADHGWHTLHPLWLAPEIHVAVAQAKAADISSYPIVLPNSESSDPSNPPTPHDIERFSTAPFSPYPPTFPSNLHLKFRLKTWTKKDNYKYSTHFWWGPDRRHPRGKRSYRERHLQKWNEKELGRGVRNRTSRLRWEIDESCGGLRDRWSSACSVAAYDDWMSDYHIYWDREPEEWIESGWWDDDGYGVVVDDGAGDCGWFTERVGALEVFHEVSGWRRLWGGYDREEMAELEDVDDEDDAFSVGSDVVVLECVVDADVDLDADLDRMSDLAELLVEGEWDVVSEASDLWWT